MRNPAFRALLVAVVALALIAGAGGAADGAATTPSPLDAAETPAHAPAVDDEPRVPDSVGDRSTTVRQQTGDGITSPSTTRIRLALNPDGAADWTVAVRYSLADENETRVFRDAGERFRDGEFGPSAELFEGFRREANRNVSRSMAIEDVEREVEVHENPGEFDVATEDAVAVGELRLQFTWTSFLAQDDESLVLGDALTTPGNETWLRSLEASQTLEVATPEGYTVTGTPSSAVTQLSDGDVIIEGPQTFEGGEPVVIVYGPAGADTPWAMLIAAIVLAAALVAGSVVGYRRISDEERDPDESAANGGEEAASGDDPDPVGGADPDPGGDAGADATDEADDGDGEDLSLLSDEERVERLLGANGGRMRQADIVAETGWSDAKVSQLLSAMADEGRVEKLRLGRENLISLPDGEDGEGGEDGRGGDDE
ncbi:MAG: helix-turn-helix transcriptional regulator [Halorubrum sp.]